MTWTDKTITYEGRPGYQHPVIASAIDHPRGEPTCVEEAARALRAAETMQLRGVTLRELTALAALIPEGVDYAVNGCDCDELNLYVVPPARRRPR